MFEGLSIRVAKEQDVEAIAHLSIQTFRDTFATSDNAADTEAYLQSHFQIQQISTELADNKNTFLLACLEDSSELIGYAKLRAGVTESCVTGENPIELERLYVDKTALGQGIGARLMQFCLDRASTQNYDTLWLGVWEHNQRAIEFYSRWEFVTVGSHIFTMGSDDQNDLIMQRPTKIER
ncbi:MAG: GNAT family N-acetyltransferase [Phormidesmis sp.]